MLESIFALLIKEAAENRSTAGNVSCFASSYTLLFICCVCVHTHRSQCTCGSQRTASRNSFAPSTMLSLGTTRLSCKHAYPLRYVAWSPRPTCIHSLSYEKGWCIKQAISETWVTLSFNSASLKKKIKNF